MKKTLIIGILLISIGVGSLVAYGETIRIPGMNPRDLKSSFSIEERESWLQEKMEFKKEQIKKAVEDGRMSELEAKEWEERFAERIELQKENNFIPGECELGAGKEMKIKMMNGNGQGMRMMNGNGMRRGNKR